jgi:type VI secretion system protein ImpA
MADLSHLLEPLDGDSPTGVNLRYVDGDLTFQQIGEFRLEEDSALAVSGEPKSAEWPKVVSACSEALESKTKDLEIAGFLAEGLAHTEGFSGARDGLEFIKNLLERHWDTLFPGFEDGEVIGPLRAKPLAWLGNRRCFQVAVRNIGFVPNAGGFLTWQDYDNTKMVDEAQVQTDQSRYNDLVEAGYVDGKAWKAALDAASTVALGEALEGVETCAAEVAEIVKFCDEKLGEDAPSLYDLETLLGEMDEMLRPRVSAASGIDETSDQATDSSGERGVAAAAGVSGPLRSRAEALHALEEVAKFFSQTEPHSPISHLIRRAVRWGKMPLEELLQEVVKSPDALTHIWETLGISPPGTSATGEPVDKGY